MKRFISVVLVAMIMTLCMTVAFAEELPANETNLVVSQNADDGTVEPTTEAPSEEDTTEPAVENTTNTPEIEETTEPASAEESQEVTTAPASTKPTKPTEPVVKKINAVKNSKDGNYKLRVYSDKKTSFVDIIKYIGKDKKLGNLKLNKIDGYKIRQIRTKAFFDLKSLKTVAFTGASFKDKGVSILKTKAFYNCPNLTQFTVNSSVIIEKMGVGYVNGKPSEKFVKLIFDDKTVTKYDVSSKLAYTLNGGFKPIYNISGNNDNNRTQVFADFVNGSQFFLKLNGKSVKGWISSRPDVLSVTDNGQAVALKKGRTAVTVKAGKLTVKRVFNVENDPYLTQKGKTVNSVKVKNGNKISVRINGKAKLVDNEFSESENAKVVSEPSGDVIVIEGTMRGTTTLTLTVNGKPLSLKVQVLKNPIPAETMERLAENLGSQDNYYYDESTVMCSAYSYAYCYKQVTGIYRTAGSFWCPGGCTWEGGTYTHYGSSRTMLKAIKKSLDKNESCVGLLSINGGSPQHYVTFYDYDDKGDSLDDFKILDPWDGELTTGENYGYSYGYHVVTVDT